MSDDDAMKYHHIRMACYARRVPMITPVIMVDYKSYNWAAWGTRPDKLRDILIQARILQRIAEQAGKDAGIMLRQRIPEEFSWFRQELRKANVHIQEGE